VEFSFQVIMTEAVPVPAMRSGTDKIRYVKAYDDRTIVYFHENSLATNIWNLNFSVIPKHIYEESVFDDPTLVNSDRHVELENDPVVGGPYQVVDRKRGQEIVLKAREDWYMHDGEQVRDRPYFETVRFKIVKENAVALMSLKSGDLDEMILTPVQWRTQTNDEDFYRNNTKAYGVEWVYFYFGWNLETPFFKDKRVRRAMSYAFDHQEMLKTLRYGMDEPAVGIFHPDSKWAPEDPPEPFTQDLDKAKALLKEAGWEDHDDDGILDKQIGGKTVPFEFTLLCPSLGDRVKYGELLQQSLDKIGIRCRVQPLEFTVLQQKTHDHQFQAYFGGWGTGADPDTSDNIWGTDENRNYVGYSNPEVDRLFEEGRREFDPEKRRKIYAKIHKILYEDQPYTWLYVRNAYYAFNKDLRGYYFSPRGPYHYGPGFGAIWKPKAAP
jgi:peptide/nickel transport system substrate-binding protein